MDAVEALRDSKVVLLPTDTVYGLAARADEAGANAVYELKGRGTQQPTALVAANVEDLLVAIPELELPAELFPGAYTFVVANPARRFPWLAGETPEKIGVRVPQLTDEARRAIEAVGVVLATSANEPGEPAAASLEDVPPRIRKAVAAEIDAGRLPGTASTVIDLTTEEPLILREGAIPAAEALSTIRAWRSRSKPSKS